jgi:hypothetical protein
MGRESRSAAARSRRIVLPADDYWQFRARINDVGVIEAEAVQVAAQYRTRIADASARTRDLFAALGKKHGFDPTKTYRWDDEARTLIEVPARAARAAGAASTADAAGRT